MLKGHTLACVLASVGTVIVSLALLIAGAIFITQLSNLRDTWTEIFSLSIYSVVIGVLGVIFGLALIYVGSRKLPALMILFSILLLVVFVLSIVCLTILAIGLANLPGSSYNQTANLILRSNSSDYVNVGTVIGHIQEQLGCCDSEKPAGQQNQANTNGAAQGSCCIVINTNFQEDINVVEGNNNNIISNMATPMYNYLRTKYITLIVLNAILVIIILVTSLSGFISEYLIRQEYELM